MKFCLATTSFKGVDRVRFLLKSICRYDLDPFFFASRPIPIIVMEDYSGDARMAEDFRGLRDEFKTLNLHILQRASWGNIQGNANTAFYAAAEGFGADWIVFLSDDTAVSSNAITNMLTFLENDPKTVGLVQFPYWNSQDFCEGGGGEWGHEPRLLKTREDREQGFYSNLGWIAAVQPNPHWQEIDQSGLDSLNGINPLMPGRHASRPHAFYEMRGSAFPYVSVHGTGFAVHAETFRKVGGFYEDTWRFDEGISYKVWTQSDRGVVALPGPPIVHYGGATAALTDGVPFSEAGSPAMWHEATGVSVKKADEQMRHQMYLKGEKMCAELRAANYWRGK